MFLTLGAESLTLICTKIPFVVLRVSSESSLVMMAILKCISRGV